MYTIEKTYTFDSAHQLIHLPNHHKCRRLHGHTYGVRVVVEVPDLDDLGMVMDFADLDQVVKPRIEDLDHRFIASGDEPVLEILPDRDVVVIGVPTTAENLAQWLGSQLLPSLSFDISPVRLVVEVAETPKSKAAWTWEK